MRSFVLLLAFLDCNGQRWKASDTDVDSSREPAANRLTALGMLLMGYSPAALPSHLSDQGIPRKLTSTRTSTVQPRVGRINADVYQLPELEVFIPTLAALVSSGFAVKLNDELTEARAAIDKATSQADLGLGRAEEEKTALSKEMDEQKMRLQSSIRSMKQEHESEADALQKKLSTIEREKSKIELRLENSRSEVVKLWKELALAKKEIERLETIHEGNTSQLQMELDEMSAKVDAQLHANKKTVALKAMVVSQLEREIEKLIREKIDLTDLLDHVEEERLALSMETTELGKQIDALTEEKSALAKDLDAEKKAVFEKALSVSFLEEEKAQWLTEKADMEKRLTSLTEVNGDGNEYLKAIAELASDADRVW